jgi:N6-adenosine-specific RNA methylase IME4
MVDSLDELIGSGKRFGAIVCDPPWSFKTWNGKPGGRDPSWRPFKNAAPKHYDTMSVADIAALPVEQLALMIACCSCRPPTKDRAIRVRSECAGVYGSPMTSDEIVQGGTHPRDDAIPRACFILPK